MMTCHIIVLLPQLHKAFFNLMEAILSVPICHLKATVCTQEIMCVYWSVTHVTELIMDDWGKNARISAMTSLSVLYMTKVVHYDTTLFCAKI